MRRFLLTLAVAAMLPFQQAWADAKPLRILVGFPPGQATDMVARILAEKLQAKLDRAVVVENKPGQGGSLVLSQLARAEPDGSQMVLGALASYVANPHIYKSVSYDTLTDFAPVALVADLPMVLIVNPQVPAKTLAELVAYAKANPGKLSHSSSGIGTLSHLGMEHLKRAAGIDILHVPYPGSGPAMLDLAGGRIDVAMDTLAVAMPQVEAGKARLIAVCTEKRLPFLPDVPTIAELGYPGFHASAWLGTVFPKGMPQPAVTQMSDALMEILKDPDVRKRFNSIGAVPWPMPSGEFAAFLKAEHARWGDLIRASGIPRQ